MSEFVTNHLDLWTSALFTKSSAGLGSNGKQEAYGIRKLRELILELAVRGKLVPQDPNDEPASVLLDRIAKEKVRLIEAGVIRKETVLPEVSEEEPPHTIPQSWEWMRLTDLYYSISPSGKKLKTSQLVGEGRYPVVDQGQSYVAGYTNDPDLLIEIPGPVVIFGDHTTELKYVDFNFVAGADGTKILRPYLMDEKFFYTYLKSYKLEDRGYARHFKVLNANLMALPPLAEQHRIVAKVDELMALCDQLEQQQTHGIEAHQTLVETLLGTLTRVASTQELTEAWTRIASHFDTLFTTEHSIDQLKQTILQLAVMGKLVPQDPNDEPASELQRRIEDEKRQLIEAGQIREKGAAAPISEEERPFGVPPSWQWARLSEITRRIHYGYTASAKPEIKSVRLLRITDIQDDTVDWPSVPGCEIEEWVLPQYQLEPGDILIARTGGTVGKTYLVSQLAVVAVFASYLIRVQGASAVFVRYLKLFLDSPTYWAQLIEGARGGAQPNVNGQTLGRMLVPLPPEPEQRRIVAKVDELMALCDALKARLADTQTTKSHLADAIVEQAIA